MEAAKLVVRLGNPPGKSRRLKKNIALSCVWLSGIFFARKAADILPLRF
jgi:hypothetical protein